MLKAGCDFRIQTMDDDDPLVTTDETIWIIISFPSFDSGRNEEETFYLPTIKRLDANNGKDWY